MKKIYSCLFILPLMIGCTSDADIAETMPPEDALPVLSKVLKAPGNSLNPYDAAGRLHNDIADLYYASPVLPTTAQGVIDLVTLKGDSNTEFATLKSTNYHAPTPLRLQYFIDNPLTSVPLVVSASPLSAPAKTSINNFINLKLPACESTEDYDTVYGIIAAYENIVLTDASLSATDKKIILTTTSIIRHSAYRKRKPKTHGDHDWEIMITHVAGTIEGAGYGIEEAITTSLSLGISENR